MGDRSLNSLAPNSDDAPSKPNYDSVSPTPVSQIQSTQGRRQFSANNFICGWGAAVFETTLVFPLHKLAFRQMLHGIKAGHAYRQLWIEGSRYLYRGLLPPLLQKTTTRAIMFGMYDEFQRIFGCNPNVQFSLCHASAAFAAGTAEAVLCPLERVQALLQSSKYHGNFRNTGEAFVAVKKLGVREFYRGLSAILVRNGTSNIFFFAFRDPLKEVVLRNGPTSPGEMQTLYAHFVSGAILGACLSTAFFPMNVVRTNMQSRMGGEFVSFYQCFKEVWRERGNLRDMFLGGRLNFIRSILSWGITNTVYELLQRHLFEETS